MNDILNRVSAYLDAKKEVTGLHEEVIHVIHTSSGKHELRVSDLNFLLGDASNRKDEVAIADDSEAGMVGREFQPSPRTLIEEIRKLRRPDNIGLPHGLSSWATVIFVLNFVEDIIKKHSASSEIRLLDKHIAGGTQPMRESGEVDNWEVRPGIPMENIKVGMKLRPTLGSHEPIITVTEITPKGFKYTHEPVYIRGGSTAGMATGGEHYGYAGLALYTLIEGGS